MKPPSYGVRIIGLLVGARLPQARPCGKAAGTRAHRSLVLGAVAPGSLRADWSSGPKGAVVARRAHAAAGFGGRLGPSGQILPQDLAEPGRAVATSKFEVPPFSSEDATKWRRQGAELQRRVMGSSPRPGACSQGSSAGVSPVSEPPHLGRSVEARRGLLGITRLGHPSRKPSGLRGVRPTAASPALAAECGPTWCLLAVGARDRVVRGLEYLDQDAKCLVCTARNRMSFGLCDGLAILL